MKKAIIKMLSILCVGLMIVSSAEKVYMQLAIVI